MFYRKEGFEYISVYEKPHKINKETEERKI